MLATFASLALGAVFVVAAAMKLIDRQNWPEQAAGLGVPRTVAVVVPWWEVLLGALLVAGVARPWPAAAAGLTLVVFTVLLVVVLRRGLHPPCACFGAVSAKPLGRGHVVRNLGLLGLAAVAVVAG